jgi:hypothetical protein
MTDENKVSDLGFEIHTGGDFKDVPVGTHDAVVHGIVYLGLVANNFKNDKTGEPMPPAPQIKIIVELPNEVRGDGQTQVMSTDVTLSCNTIRGNYAPIIAAITKTKQTPESMAKYMYSDGLKELLGKAVGVTVSEWEKDGRKGVMLERKGFFQFDYRLPQPVPKRPAFFFSPVNPDIEVFEKTLTAWTRKKIMEAVNVAQFPDVLKQSWAKMQVEDAAAEEARKQPNKSAAANGPTTAIE